MRTVLRTLASKSGPISKMAQSLLSGEKDAIYPLQDLLEEEGLLMQTILEKGKKYMIKTATLYYLGKVKEISWTRIVLEDVTEVYDTGPVEQCFGKGIISQGEPFPKGLEVVINPECVFACPEWTHKLPPEIRST